MVTEAGKDLLRNSLNTANFHNKILEENDMWKQWEVERSLTMMVSDEDIMSRSPRKKRQHFCSKHRRRDKERMEESLRLRQAKAKDPRPDRWDHSGFKELYPDESDTPTTSSSTSEAPSTKKKKKKKRSGSSDDDEIHKDFKMYMRMTKKRSKTEKKSSLDSHIIEWKKHRKTK